jgi:hypothetical protein
MAVAVTHPDRTRRNHTSNLVVREQLSRQREADADAQNPQLSVEAARQRYQATHQHGADRLVDKTHLT